MSEPIVIPADVVSALEAKGYAISDLAGVRITMTDIRRAGFCAPGLLDWLRDYGFSLKELSTIGLSAARVAATGNVFGVRGAMTAMERAYGR
jgi:hypothetical protein